MFSDINSNSREQAFKMFVSSVLRQVAAQENKEIIFDQTFPSSMQLSKVKQLTLDAVAPNGLMGKQEPIIFEFKYSFKESFIQNVLNKIISAYSDENLNKTISIIIITYSTIGSKTELLSNSINDRFRDISVKIIDRKVVDEWVFKYPMDYNHALSFFDKKIVEKTNAVAIDNENLESKSNDNILVLRNEIQTNDCFALVLGAGVSIDIGAKSWDDLLVHFENELKKLRIIDDVDELCKKVGGSSLITAQLCKDLYKNDTDFYWAIHSGLYDTFYVKTEYEMNEIIKIIKKCLNKKHFRILTYNFDDYLEQFLTNNKMNFNVLYSEKGNVTEQLSIYHVHGYLPKVNYKTHMNLEHGKSIYLTEENYNELYNQPYSWQISSQLSFFRENICLFVGCSLSDPNIRRLLELTRKTNKKHYAILAKGGMSIKDLSVASNHFARLGIEIIWVDSFEDIIPVLRKLY